MNDAPPKYPDTAAVQYQQNPTPPAAAGASDNVATRAMDLVANNNPQMIQVALNAVSQAAEIVARHNTPPAAPPAQTLESELEREFKRAMIARLTAPPVDPLETYLRIRDALGVGNNQGGIGGMKDFLELISSLKTSGLVSIGAPAAALGRTTLLDLGRELIPVVGTVMHEYRLSREADARITEIQRRAMPPHQPAPTVAQPNPPAPVTQLPAVVQPAPQSATPAPPTMTFPQIEAHIASIISNSQFTTDEAVDEVLAFLYNTDPRLVGALLNPPSISPQLKPGKEGLMMLCTYPKRRNSKRAFPTCRGFRNFWINSSWRPRKRKHRKPSCAPLRRQVLNQRSVFRTSTENPQVPG